MPTSAKSTWLRDAADRPRSPPLFWISCYPSFWISSYPSRVTYLHPCDQRLCRLCAGAYCRPPICRAGPLFRLVSKLRRAPLLLVLLVLRPVHLSLLRGSSAPTTTLSLASTAALAAFRLSPPSSPPSSASFSPLFSLLLFPSLSSEICCVPPSFLSPGPSSLLFSFSSLPPHLSLLSPLSPLLFITPTSSSSPSPSSSPFRGASGHLRPYALICSKRPQE